MVILPNDTEIGTFQIKSSNENFLLRIGGFAKLTGYYDAGLENELFFDLYKIPTVENRPLGRFNMHAYESRLNMEVFGQTWTYFMDLGASPSGGRDFQNLYLQEYHYWGGETYRWIWSLPER